MRILVIDDDADIRAILGMVLTAEGHEVETAADGLAGLARLRGGPRPALILLDLMMPQLDGEGFLRELRRDPLTAGVPVVILSGHTAGGKMAVELGAAGYLGKPVELMELLGAVQRAGGAPPAS
jgi:CheY-like chemotaxis protein